MNSDNLPKLAPFVGGEIDIMLGAKYLRYHPKPVFQLASGLTIYQSAFNNADGGRGVIGGPHKVFSEIEQHYQSIQELKTFFVNQAQLYNIGISVNPDVELLHIKVDKDYSKSLMYNENSTVLTSRNQKIFNQAEEAGSTITYRCISCRNCKDCKEHESIESISVKEEVEQHMINQSITIDTESNQSFAKLPLLHNPTQQLGFVDYVRNLSPSQSSSLIVRSHYTGFTTTKNH